MSEENTQPTTVSSAEDRQRRIEEQTSVGRYTMKQVKQEGVLILGAVAGYFAARGLLKNNKVAEWAEGKVASIMPAPAKHSIWQNTKELSQRVFGFVGIMAGTMVSGIINTYEHWKNLESEKLAVAEINKDVGNLVGERAKFADTLNRQEAIIKELVAKGQDKGNFADRSATVATSVQPSL